MTDQVKHMQHMYEKKFPLLNASFQMMQKKKKTSAFFCFSSLAQTSQWKKKIKMKDLQNL